MQLPFISVILPVRNEERYIAACVDSIFSQDYPAEKMEVIFVDGRSEDRTVEMLHAMQKNHPQIVVLDNPNRTVPYAMNIGHCAQQRAGDRAAGRARGISGGLYSSVRGDAAHAGLRQCGRRL